MDEWVRSQYRARFCDKNGRPKDIVNLDSLRDRLVNRRPNQEKEIRAAIKALDLEICGDICQDFERDEKGHFKDPSAARAKLLQSRPDLPGKGQATKIVKQLEEQGVQRPESAASTSASTSTDASAKANIPMDAPAKADTSKPQSYPPLPESPFIFSAGGSRRVATATGTKGKHSASKKSSDDDIDNISHSDSSKPDFSLIDRLMTAKNRSTNTGSAIGNIHRDIGHAPLVSDGIVTTYSDVVQQYGFLGSCMDDADNSITRIFQNTNVPFSTFVCGVQGSGKSHTTAVMLENAILRSGFLGHQKAPVSALVFSYGEFTDSGRGFDISEVAYLATANKAFEGHRVKKITVLISSSNADIGELYQQIPNVEVIPLKLNPKTLDIGTLLALMAVDEKAGVPLYMARVESILRTIATENKSGILDYDLFKKRLDRENFDSAQTNMLDMRLDVLESFLDKEGTAPQPQFRPGEITIVDLSDPFVKPHTACILFKLCLKCFMQSPSPGKMVVLDEAHKYMMNNPGSKVLTEYLKTLVRLERHKGARLIISTQEPTVSTDLIALCSVTIVHRFTSPTWFAALKQHIRVMDKNEDIMEEIEGLATGEALVYCPRAVLSKNEDEILQNATGRLLRLNIRIRVTSDGGESVMAVQAD